MARGRGYWLVKSEPSTYAWQQLVEDGSTMWEGVRNFSARNHLAGMRRGDLVLFYHSGEGREVVGVAKVVREAYPDPTSDDERWRVVDVAAVKPLKEPVPLATIKADPKLRDIPLVRQGRLSAMPLPKAAFERILALGKTKV